MLDLESIKMRCKTAETELWEAPVGAGSTFLQELVIYAEAVRADIPALVTEVERLQTAISSFGHLMKATRGLYCFASTLEKGWSCEALNYALDMGWRPEGLRKLAGNIQKLLSDLRSEAE